MLVRRHTTYAHVGNHVWRVSDLDADLGEARAEWAHAEGYHEGRAADHGAVQQPSQQAVHVGRSHLRTPARTQVSDAHQRERSWQRVEQHRVGTQLLVGPASAWRCEQMKVCFSTRATSDGAERAK